MNNSLIKVEICVAYDWYYLSHSLPLIYDHADHICLSLDKDRISWAGLPFEFNEPGFRELIDRIDVVNKIQIYEDNFHLPELTPMQNEVRQRNMMANFLGTGGWHVQLDADEYFIDFKAFVTQLKLYKGKKDVNICVPWITLFKRTETGWMYVQAKMNDLIEYIPVATLLPKYEYGRRNGYFNYKINSPLVHQSWARSKSEIKLKVENWGHKNDFDTFKFLELWNSLDESNYMNFKNFHPIDSTLWSNLEFIPKDSINDLVHYFKLTPPILLTKDELKKQNSLFRSRLKSLLQKAGIKV